MLEDLSDREKYGLAGALALSLVMAYSAGAIVSGNGITGAFTGGETVSEDEVEKTVNSLLSQQMEQQRQSFTQIANQSENISEEDLSIKSEVETVSQSKFDSLYKVEISMTGEVPNQLSGGTQSLDETQVMYISDDGRYMFQEPTDLEQPQQQAPQQSPSGQ